MANTSETYYEKLYRESKAKYGKEVADLEKELAIRQARVANADADANSGVLNQEITDPAGNGNRFLEMYNAQLNSQIGPGQLVRPPAIAPRPYLDRKILGNNMDRAAYKKLSPDDQAYVRDFRTQNPRKNGYHSSALKDYDNARAQGQNVVQPNSFVRRKGQRADGSQMPSFDEIVTAASGPQVNRPTEQPAAQPGETPWWNLTVNDLIDKLPQFSPAENVPNKNPLAYTINDSINTLKGFGENIGGYLYNIDNPNAGAEYGGGNPGQTPGAAPGIPATQPAAVQPPPAASDVTASSIPYTAPPAAQPRTQQYTGLPVNNSGSAAYVAPGSYTARDLANPAGTAPPPAAYQQRPVASPSFMQQFLNSRPVERISDRKMFKGGF